MSLCRYTLCYGSSFFFFKQKTAYEVRISDWSSDVCSSDLEDRVEVEVVEMLGAAADLAQQLGAADHLVEAAAAELGENLAHFLGDEGHQVDDLLRAAGEFGAELFILGADADRAGIAVALTHHDAAHGDEAQRSDAIFLGAENRRDHDVAPGLEPAVGAQADAVAQPVERQHLIDFGQAHFPRRAGIFDAGLRARTGAAGVARDEDDVGMRSEEHT